MFNKRRLLIGFRIIIAVFLFIYLLKVTPITLSKYEKTVTSDANINVAIYLLKADYSGAGIYLLDLTPRNDPYIYTFKLANNDGTKRSDTDLEYDLTLVRTTNMPVTINLYKNYDTTNSIITGSTTAADSDGTYFTTYTTAKETFNYTTNMENIYQLYVYFPLTYNSANYQDLIEYMKINVDSKQILD